MARKLARERVPIAKGFAKLIAAGALAAGGDAEAGAAELRSGVAFLDGLESGLHAAAARRRLGAVLGGDAGKALSSSSDAWFADQGVKSPPRIMELLTPGWGDSR